MKNTDQKSTRSGGSPAFRILAGSIAALLAVHAASASTLILNGQEFEIVDGNSTTGPADTWTWNDTGTLTINDGGTLFTHVSQLGQPTKQVNNDAIELTGNAGTITLRFNGNDSRHLFTGAITSTATGNQVIAIRTGDAGSNGERTNVVFASAIPDGTGGNTLGLSMNFRTSTDTSSHINLTAGGTFTGGITMVKGDTNNQRDYLVIGGERFELAFNSNRFNTQGASPSNATLGTTAPGVGSYAGAISLDTGSILNYNSTGTQTFVKPQYRALDAGEMAELPVHQGCTIEPDARCHGLE